MKIKNLLTAATLIALLTAAGCNEDDPSSKDPIDQLPPPTQEGENTFGCLVNGEAWVPQSSIDNSAIYQSDFLTIGANFEEREQNIIIWLSEQELKLQPYLLNSQSVNKAFLFNPVSDCDYETYDPQSGKLTIEFLDFEDFIIAGTFEFEAVSDDCQDTVRVTEGRFDLNYIP